MSKKVSEFFGCPLARECRNDACILRLMKVFNYDPSYKAISAHANRDIETRLSAKGLKVFTPKFENRVSKGDNVSIVCHDYKDR